MKWQLLSTLSGEQRRRVLAASHRRRYARREVIFHQDDPADTLHLVERGHVAVRMTTPRGDVAILVVLGPGDVLGELALLDGKARRMATAVALERTETRALHRNDFAQLRHEDPSVDRFLIEAMAAEIGRLSAALLEALYLPVETRVLRRLAALATLYGPDAAQVTIPLTQDDLASLAGTSRATANRILRQAEEAGLLSLQRGQVRVPDVGALARRAR